MTEHVRHHIASRTSIFINNHGFWSVNSITRSGKATSITDAPVAYDISRQQIDYIVGYFSTAIVTLINEYSFFIHLREVITIKVIESSTSRIWHVDISNRTIA